MVMVGLRGVAFRYGLGHGHVFDDLSLVFEPGRTALLGPNGAGKSTIFGLLAGVHAPRRGAITLGDPPLDARPTELRRSVGWMPQDIETVPGLRVREQVAYAGWLKGMRRSDARAAAMHAVRRAGLDQLADRPSRRLSGGERRRLGFSQVLVHEPSVMLLDEPFAGLDPLQRERFRTIVAATRVAGAIVVSTHDVEDIDDLFDHVVVLDAGRVVFQGSVPAFMSLAPAGSGRPGAAAFARALAAGAA